MPNETELKKAWNLIIQFCQDRFKNCGGCNGCLFYDECIYYPSDNEKIEVNDEK